MRRTVTGVLLVAALATCAGCATVGTPGQSPTETTVSDPTGECYRSGGVYNRAAGLCVGRGGV